MPELISCVLATGDRRPFFRQALRCFLRQSYRHSELIVVDDGQIPVADLCAGLDRVRYVRLAKRTPTGAKLNIGIRQARGTILQKLDDDDYYHPTFLEVAASQLPTARRDRTLVAWDCFLVLLAGDRRVRFSGHGWKAGGTFCFGRELWKRTPFRDLPADEDYWFLRDQRPKVVPVCAPELYLLVRHGGNTWRRMPDGQPADEYLRRLPAYGKSLDTLVSAQDRPFYRRLARAKRPSVLLCGVQGPDVAGQFSETEDDLVPRR